MIRFPMCSVDFICTQPHWSVLLSVFVLIAANSLSLHCRTFPIRGFQIYDGPVQLTQSTFRGFMPTPERYTSAVGFNLKNTWQLTPRNNLSQLLFQSTVGQSLVLEIILFYPIAEFKWCWIFHYVFNSIFDNIVINLLKVKQSHLLNVINGSRTENQQDSHYWRFKFRLTRWRLLVVMWCRPSTLDCIFTFFRFMFEINCYFIYS